MAKLGTIETKIQKGTFSAFFLAEYFNGALDKVLCSIEIKGSVLNWHYSQEHGLHKIWDWKDEKTDCLKILEDFINPKIYKLIESQINTFKNEKP